MTSPFNLRDETQKLTGELDSAVAGAEWSSFLAKRKELLDIMMQSAMDAQDAYSRRRGFGDVESGATSTVPVVPGASSRKPSQEQIGQAHFWGIASPEGLDAQELQHQIEQRRAEVPAAERSSLRSAGFATAATYASAAGAAAQLTQHAVENVGGALDYVPFIGPVLHGIMNSEMSKSFWQFLQQKSGEAVEAARSEQPASDLASFNFWTGAGKMAGYALPAVAAWEGLGAIAGLPRLAWLGRVGTPMMRAAAKGALTSAALTDPEASGEEKAIDIGLGAFLGGAQMYGRFGAAAGLGALGAGVGAQAGSTPEERTKNAAIGLAIGASIPFAAPVLGGAFSKVRAAFKTPLDEAIANATHSSPGESIAEWEFVNDAPQVSGNPAPAKRLMAGGQDVPDYGGAVPEVAPVGEAKSPQTADELHALIASEGATPAGVVEQTPAVGAPRNVRLLPSSTEALDPNITELRAEADHFQRLLVDPGYRAAQGHPEDLDARSELWPDGSRNYLLDNIARLNAQANGLAYTERTALAKVGPTFATVSQGPQHLIGSAVADVSGKPLRVYHGTGMDFESFDPTKLDNEALFGPGLYHTESQEIAAGYSGNMQAGARWVQGGQAEAMRRMQEVINRYDYKVNDFGPEQEWHDNTIRKINSYIPDATALEMSGIQVSDLLEGGSTPNVRPAYLDIKNPFDIDKLHSAAEVESIVSRLSQIRPEIDWRSRPGDVTPSSALDEAYMNDDSGALKGEDLYFQLSSASLKDPMGPLTAQETTDRTNRMFEDNNADFVGKAGLNRALQDIGYDGITHIGGARTGNDPHRVWIAFDPRQVHPYFSSKALTPQEAVQTAHGLTKQATVMESQDLPIATGKTEVTESDAVKAAQTTNPGGVAILRGISKPLDVLKNHDVKFVEIANPDGSTRLDAIIGEATPDMVLDYQRWGTMEGNIVVSPGGIEGTVQSINSKGIAMVRRMNGGPGLRIKVSNLQPSRFSDPIHSAYDLWDSFKADLLRYMNEEAEAAQMAPVDSIWDPRVPGQMAQHLQDFLNRRGINDQATRHAIDADINARWVDAARDLDPEARDFQLRAITSAEDAFSQDQLSDEPIPVSLEEKAESRGFIWLSNPQAEGGILRDTLNPEGALEIPVETDDAAEEFLRNVDRTAPDFTPASDVPVDVMGWAPSDGGWEPRVGVEESADELVEATRQRDAELEQLGTPEPSAAQLDAYKGTGGGGAGFPPNGPGNGAGAGGFALPAGQPETLGGQFQRLYNEHPEKYAQLVRKWTGQHFQYTRYLMGSLENDLVRAGVDMGRAWQHVARLEDQATKGMNEAYDWLKEAADIVRGFPNELHRNGFVVRTHEVLNEQNRMTRWWSLQTKGYSDKAIKKMIESDDRLADFYHRLFMSGVESPEINFQPEREIERYISHVRQRQAQGMTSADAVYNSQGLLSPNTQFFAEFAREGNMQFRVMDTRALTDYYVRSMMFKKYQAEAYRDLVTTWQDGRIPEPIRNLLLDHASAMRFGFRPEPGLATKAVRGLVENVLRVPMTNSEAARFIGMPLGGMYQSLLGGKTSIFFRDAIQPLMTLTKVRMPYMADAYKQVLGFWRTGEGGNELAQAYANALKHGWVGRERAPMEALTSFEQQEGSSAELLALSPEQKARREVLARIGDAMLPHWLQRSTEKVNLLRLYGRMQRLNQFISGQAAYTQAKSALTEYRRLETEAAVAGDPSLALSYNEFARKSFFSSFEPAIRNHLKELVDAGQDEEAAASFAREATKWSQQVYTTREKPAALRGGFGRLASFLMNFTGQFLNGTYKAMRHGEPEHIARAAMVIGGTSAALYQTGKALGLPNLSRWAWTSALHTVVNPVVERIAQATLAVGAIGSMADERGVSPVGQSALENLPGVLPTLNDYNPLSGYMNTAAGISEAAQGTTPARDIAALMVTGDRGSRIQYGRDARQRADLLYQRLQGNPTYAPGNPGPQPTGGPLTDFINRIRSHPGNGGQQ